MFTSSWVALTDLNNCCTHRDVYALLAPHTITPFHQLAQTHIPMKDLPLSSSRFFSTVSAREDGPTLQLDLLRRSPAFPQQQGRPAASARRGFWWRWPSPCRPFPPHHCHRARQRCASGYAQNTCVQQKQGRQWHRARDLKLSKTYWGLCLIRRNSSFAILSY